VLQGELFVAVEDLNVRIALNFWIASFLQRAPCDVGRSLGRSVHREVSYQSLNNWFAATTCNVTGDRFSDSCYDIWPYGFPTEIWFGVRCVCRAVLGTISKQKRNAIGPWIGSCHWASTIWSKCLIVQGCAQRRVGFDVAVILKCPLIVFARRLVQPTHARQRSPSGTGTGETICSHISFVTDRSDQHHAKIEASLSYHFLQTSTLVFVCFENCKSTSHA